MALSSCLRVAIGFPFAGEALRFRDLLVSHFASDFLTRVGSELLFMAFRFGCNEIKPCFASAGNGEVVLPLR